MVADTDQAPATEPKAKVFISYSRKDLAFAGKVATALAARGFEPLIDRNEIYAFEDWWKRVEALISRSDTVVFILSPDSVASPVALKEIEHAASLNKRFAPIVCRPVADSAVPEPLRRLNFIFFDDPERFEAGADQLAEALNTDIGWIRQHTEYGEASRRWIGTGRHRGLLLHSPILEVAEHWIVSRPRTAPEPTPEIHMLIGESRKGARATQRRWRTVQSAIMVLLIGIIAGLIGWIEQSYIRQQWKWFWIERPYAAADIKPYVLSAPAEHALRPSDSFRECADAWNEDNCPVMVVVPAGSFTMGSPPVVKGNVTSEQPQHRVAISQPFAVAKFALTFDEWDVCYKYGECPAVDDTFGRGQLPVINVTWRDAQRYVAWLSKMTGKHYRLLTEAEYEYAARAGTQTLYPWGDELGANHADCHRCGSQWDNVQPAPVGSFPANAFGLHEMIGGVWEWVEDCAHNNYEGAPTDGSAWIEGGNCKSRVDRGGSWFLDPEVFGSAVRRVGDIAQEARYDSLGFRVARTLSLGDK